MPPRCNSPDAFNFTQLRLNKGKEKEHDDRRDAETEEQREIKLRLERRSTSDVMSERLKNRERLGQREGA